MNIYTLTAFETELKLIKKADAAGLVKQVVKKLPNVAPKIQPVNEFTQLASKIMKSPSMSTGHLGKYGSAKMAGAAGAFGALGAGLVGLHGGLKEWDSRSAENTALSNTPEDRRAGAHQFVNEARKHRLKRLAVNAALAGGSGAMIGHFGTKAVRGLADTASKGMAQNLKPAIEEALSKGHSQGLQEGSRGVFWKALNPFKKK